MQPTLQIATACDSPVRFERWRAMPEYAGIDNHPLSGGFARSYYPLVFGQDRRDVSFSVVAGDEPKLIVLCSIGADVIDYYGQPILFFDDGSSTSDVNCAIDAAFNNLATTVGQHTHISIRASAGEQTSSIGAACNARGFVATRRFKGLCDLSVGEEGLRSAIRRRYRPMVNWGRRNIALTYVNASNPDRTAFAQYQAFHHQVAGSITRPQETWDAMYDWIVSGKGELVLGHFNEALVAGTMVVDGNTTSYYASGVYDRALFDKPIGHWPMHSAIVRCIDRGIKWFEIGDIPAEGSVGVKEYNVGQFKKGFATEIAEWTNWSFTGSPNELAENRENSTKDSGATFSRMNLTSRS